MKIWVIIIAVVLLACVAWLGSRVNKPVAEGVLDPSQGPAFEVHVVMPRGGLPLFGILPEWVVKKHNLTPHELRYDHTSPGARIGTIRHDRLELSADGWELFIETDGEGRVAPATYLVFKTGLGGRQVRLNCRPADRAKGYLSTTTRAGSDDLDGRFVVEFATCKNAESGKTIDWPPAPLTVRGSFVGPQH